MDIYLATLLKHQATSLSLIHQSSYNPFLKIDVKVTPMFIFYERQVILLTLKIEDFAYSSYCAPKTQVFETNCSFVVAINGLSD
jgi:hypothetical protein